MPDAVVLYSSTVGALFAALLVCPWLQQCPSEFSFSRTAFIWQHQDIYHKSQEQVLFAAFAKILKLTSLYSEQFCPELMRFLTCLRIPRIKPLSLGRGRFRKIISNSLNHHGSRKRESSFYWVKRFTDWRQGQREKYSLPSLPPSVLQKEVLENKVGTESFSIVVGVSESHGTKGMRPGGSPREVNQCICAHMQDVAGDYSCTNLVPVIPISDVSSGVLENT